jgi:DUF971 family protein
VQLKQFRQEAGDRVRMVWDDGHDGGVSLQPLRDACPCAGCKGETILLQTFVPPPPDVATPGRYVLKGASMVGNYGLQLQWADGHGEGIYSWEILRALCECPQCVAERTASETPPR